ncbi:hypothetical protein OG756_04020 [Streptomyces sp. NBC_01310]|nr:hypothetical protein OG756_04020 [Streptomyces sp. NBC_01310]
MHRHASGGHDERGKGQGQGPAQLHPPTLPYRRRAGRTRHTDG